MATLVYRFGLLSPTHEAGEVWAQMRAAHRYRNTLTEIERGRRAALRRAEQEDPALAGATAARLWLEAEAEVLGREAKAQRSKSRKRGITSDVRERLIEARGLVARCKMGIRLYRCFVVLPALQGERDRINTIAAGLRKNARKYRPWGLRHHLRHGTYTMVEDADQASSKKLPLAEDPDFRRWTGEGQIVDGEVTEDAFAEGSVGVQVQGGASVEEVTVHAKGLRVELPKGRSLEELASGGHTQVQILPSRGAVGRYALPRRDGRPRREGRGARTARVLRIRVGSNPDRTPVWAEWPLCLRRDFPPEAKIMRVAVHCRRIGPREEWYATFTLRIPDQERRRGDKIAVAVDVGWRLMPDGSVRVAYWRGEDGRHDQLVLTPRQVEGLTKADSIQAIRDRVRNEMVEKLGAILPELRDKAPEGFEEAVAYMAQWRSHKRFYQLRDTWRRNRFAGDGEAFRLLDAWVARDRHLWEYESGQRMGSLRNRKDFFRRFAKWLSTQYDCVVLEKKFIQQAAFTRRKPTEDGAQTEETMQRRLQSIAAPSSLCDILKVAFKREGEVSVQDGAYTTINCAETDGGTIESDAAADVSARYSCGHVHDQDDNAARNLLKLHRERSSDEKKAGTARVKDSEGRRERSRRMRAEREARLAAAREASDNAAE